MENKTKVFRIYLSSYNKIKRIIRPRKNETTAEYFDRVLGWIYGVKEVQE